MMKIGTAFELNGVAHLIRPWGPPAQDLEQLRQGIAAAPADVIFHHAVQYQLRHPGADELPPDDFSAWIGGVVQDAETAERMSFVVQGRNASPESLRAALLEVLDAVPEKRRVQRDAPEDCAFLFMSASSAEFLTETPVRDGQELVDALIESDACVWFYHLIQQPWFANGRSPLLDWLAPYEPKLASWLEEATHSGMPIDKARTRVQKRWRRSCIGKHLAEATTKPEDTRREAGRLAVARLVRRRTRTGDGL